MLAAKLLQNRFLTTEKREKMLEKYDGDGSTGLFCRTCLSTTNLRPLFSRIPQESEEMSYKLNLVTGLKIKKDDGLSQEICTKCLGAIDFALHFRFKSKEAEQYLLNIRKTIKEPQQIIEPIKNYRCLEIETVNNETQPEMLKTEQKLAGKYKLEIKIEHNRKENEQTSFSDEIDYQNDDHLNCDTDSEEDLKPLKLLKKVKDEPNSVLEPIITIKRISNETSNKDAQNTVKLKTKNVESFEKKRKKQDRLNKLRTFIKVDHLPADWYGFIKPKIKDKRKKILKKPLDKIPKEITNEKVLDVTGDEVPVFIKVENFPEDIDKVPMPKVPRPHRRIALPEGPPYKCSVCDKQYMKRPMYLAHVRFHTHFHICEQCGKRFKNSSLLRQHQRAIHGAAKIHKCSQCDYTAATKCALIVHERRHKDERPFVCDHCGAAFFTRRTLAQHIGVHMPANIQCPHCPKKCKSMKLLSNHRARKHARRYIYHCPVCPKQFNDNNAVHKHLSGYHSLPREQHPTIEKQLVG